MAVHARQAFHVPDAGGDHADGAVGSDAEDLAIAIVAPAAGAHVERVVAAGGDPAWPMQPCGDDGEDAGVQAADAARLLLDDEQAALGIESEAGRSIECGRRHRDHAARADAIDDAAATVGHVAHAAGGDGDTGQLVTAVDDRVEGRERGDCLLGVRGRGQEQRERHRGPRARHRPLPA
jgi:hypothetical protein